MRPIYIFFIALAFLIPGIMMLRSRLNQSDTWPKTIVASIALIVIAVALFIFSLNVRAAALKQEPTYPTDFEIYEIQYIQYFGESNVLMDPNAKWCRTETIPDDQPQRVERLGVEVVRRVTVWGMNFVTKDRDTLDILYIHKGSEVKPTG